MLPLRERFRVGRAIAGGMHGRVQCHHLGQRFFLPWRPLTVTPLELDRLQTIGIGTVLQSEFLWVWLPATAMAAAAWLARRVRRVR